MREGLPVAIVGPPNAGKSSLLNALLGEDRAIVSEIPGTTRDTIEESIAVEGVPVRLIDTAGIRAHADRLEARGIERTGRALAAARIALVVIDGSQPLGADAARCSNEPAIASGSSSSTKPISERAACAAAAESERGRGKPPRSVDARGASTRDRAARMGRRRIDLSRPHLTALYEFDAVNAAIERSQRRSKRCARTSRSISSRPGATRLFGARACNRAGRRRRDNRRNFFALLYRQIRGNNQMKRALLTLAALCAVAAAPAAASKTVSAYGVTVTSCVVNSNGSNMTNGINVVYYNTHDSPATEVDFLVNYKA